MRRILIFTALLFLCGCVNREYKYVEVLQEEGVLGTTMENDSDPKSIQAASDSAAYLEAYKRFCISQKTFLEMQDRVPTFHTVPKYFKLFNNKGEDIVSSVDFITKKEKEAEILQDVLKMPASFEKDKTDSSDREIEDVSIDTAKIRELSKYFRIKKDEFSNDDKKWYTPKSAPNYANANGIYCYFQAENGKAENLRFRVQYYADDWLFFQTLQFSIDGKAYDYIPGNVETDNGDGGYIWEWFDESLTLSDKDLIVALSNAKTAKMKFNGRQYYNVKTITKEQIAAIKRTLELYYAMGGRY